MIQTQCNFLVISLLQSKAEERTPAVYMQYVTIKNLISRTYLQVW